MHAVLAGRLPEGQVLSHDLLEGSLARCAAVTDITLIEDAPFHADVAASRVHRWTRGDWQLLPFLLQRRALPAARHQPLEDARQPAPLAGGADVAGAAAAGAGRRTALSPWAALALVLAAFAAGPLMGAVAGFSPSRDDIAKLHFYRQAGGRPGARRCAAGCGTWRSCCSRRCMAVDAIVRALYRMAVSRRHLLQWTTAAAAQAAAATRLRSAAAPALAAEPLLAAAAAARACSPSARRTRRWRWRCACCGRASPLWTWWVSRPRPARADAALPPPDQRLPGRHRARHLALLRALRRRPQDNHLPPDNLQTAPHDMVAHRTSPTNIGLYLLSVACARQFGWIGTQELLARLEATLATLATLQRHRGHFLNWYDTADGAPLLPMYVSTVDSGNLSGHLLAVAQACLELAARAASTPALPRSAAPARPRRTRGCAAAAGRARMHG